MGEYQVLSMRISSVEQLNVHTALSVTLRASQDETRRLFFIDPEHSPNALTDRCVVRHIASTMLETPPLLVRNAYSYRYA